MTDEKVLSYIKKCLDAGRMSEAIETSEISKVSFQKRNSKITFINILKTGGFPKL
jgi:hypothetical protein